MHKNIEELMDSDPLLEVTVPELDRNGIYRHQFQIDLENRDSGFHHLILVLDEIAEDLYGGGSRTALEGFEIDDDKNVVVRCDSPGRPGTSGVPDPFVSSSMEPHQ